MWTLGHRHAARPSYPWYSMNPHSLRWSRIALALLIVLAGFSFSEKHLWRWQWHSGFHAWYNCQSFTDARGRRVEAWRWVEGREIRLYAPSAMSDHRVQRTAEGVRGLIRELNLDIAVRTLPITPRIAATLARHTTRVAGEPSLDVDAFCRDLVATRSGQYAEMIITPGRFNGAEDTLGMAFFNSGTALICEECANDFLARHETGHLLGYHQHDNYPFIVVGYTDVHLGRLVHRSHGEISDASLMMPQLKDDRLSDRSRDALDSFWHGLEDRTGQNFHTVTLVADPICSLHE